MVIEARGLGKNFALFDSPKDRLKQLLWGRWRQYSRDFWAISDVNFEVRRGEVIGLIGRNGAGKSTLLQMVCGTLAPSVGSLTVRGRVAALLELGAGFSPDFTGLENVYMNAAILGLTRAEVDRKLDGILAFADIGKFIHQPVKTYSSGMFMRLAFAVATSVEPDILVIDEALSVGDGAFARKSFDRIMSLKDNGATILFCSHAMYHVQALCARAIWMEGGKVRMIDAAAKVTSAYETALVTESADHPHAAANNVPLLDVGASSPDANTAASPKSSVGRPLIAPVGTAIILDVKATADGVEATELVVHSGKTTLSIQVNFASDIKLPCPSVAVGIAHANGMVVASAGSANDGLVLNRGAGGLSVATLVFDELPLLQGDYSVSVILGDERGLHIYEVIERCIRLRVVQADLEQGFARLPHRWVS